MSIEQMIWRSSDHCLEQDLIRRQIEVRKGYAYSAAPITEVPF